MAGGAPLDERRPDPALPGDDEHPPERGQGHGRREHGPSYRILVIEDNIDAAESMEMLLHLMGHEVETAYDGPVGVELARRCRPEIVICDIGLPGPMDGHAVAQILRREFPRGSAFM